MMIDITGVCNPSHRVCPRFRVKLTSGRLQSIELTLDSGRERGGMDPFIRLDYFRKEHSDILQFLEKWEDALSLIASKDDVQRTKALSDLREMESELQAIRNHCNSEERNLESPYRSYLKKEQFHIQANEHGELGRFAQ
jgi:hypothetical protein